MTEILELQWTEHSQVFSDAVLNLRSKNMFSDAILACEGKFFPVHKFVLSTCSTYFSSIFDITPCSHPVVVINNISCRDLECLLSFMYCGEASVLEQHIQDVMRAASYLHIKGLTVPQESSSKTKNSDGLQTNIPVSLDKQIPKKTPCHLSRNGVPEMPNLQMPDMQKMTYTQAIQSFAQASMAASSANRLPSIGSFTRAPLPLLNNGLGNSNQQPLTPQENSMQMKNGHNTRDHVEIINSFSDHSNFAQGSFNAVKKESSSTMEGSLSPANCVASSQIKNPKESISYTKFQSVGTEVNMKSDGQSVQMDEKLMNEDLSLDRTVRNLQIDTENGTVTIPDILDGFVDMKNLYEEKESCGDSEDLESQTSHVSNASQNLDPEKAATPLTDIIPFQEETNDTLYEFTDEVSDSSQVPTKETGLRSSSRINNSLKRENEATSEAVPNKKLHTSAVGRTRSTNSPVPSTSRNSPAQGQFACDKCSRVCKKRDSLTRHMRTHDEYPYTCTMCGLKSKVYKDHMDHSKTHATVKCTKCTYTTIRKENLRRHMRSHDEKAHKCTFENCKQAFRRIQQLKTHLLNHVKKEKNSAQ